MLNGIEKGLELEEQLPFDFQSKQEIVDALEHLKKLMHQEPLVKEAYDKRTIYMKDLYQQLVDNNIINDEGGYAAYYHRRVLDYMTDELQQKVIHGKKLSKAQRDFMHGRTGTKGKDYSTNFIESEFKVVADGLFELKKKETLDAIMEPFNKQLALLNKKGDRAYETKLNQIKKEFGTKSPEYNAFNHTKRAFKKQFIEQNKPEGYQMYQPTPGNHFFRQSLVTEKQVEKVMNELIHQQPQLGQLVRLMDELVESSRDRLVLAGKKEQFLIPNELAKTLEDIGTTEKADPPFEQFLMGTVSRWKFFVLMNPARILKYNLNNMMGDLDGVISSDPSILKHSKNAAKEVFNYVETGKVTTLFNKALEQNVIDSGFDLTELGDINQQKWAQSFLKKNAPMDGLFSKASLKKVFTNKNPIKNYTELAQKWTATRENWFRYAAFLRALEKIEQGDTFYWSSDPKQIDAITDNYEKAGKLSREALGDYGNISDSGQYLRKHLIPFYSWMEINMGRYFRLFKNASNPNVQARIGAAMLKRGITSTAFKMIQAYAYTMVFTAAVSAYNALLHPEEEDELKGADVRGLQLIVGKTPDGKIISVPIVGAFYDFIDFFGLPDLREQMDMIVSGNDPIRGVKEGAETLVKAPINKIVQGVNPLIKSSSELFLKKSLYPNVFEPRPIKSRTEYLARFFSMKKAYRYVTEKPMRKKFFDTHWASDLLFREFDVQETAYFQTKSLVGKYKGYGSSGTPDDEQIQAKREALYNYATAIRYEQNEEADKWLERYYLHGGTEKGLNTSITNKHPLHQLSKAEKKDVMHVIDGHEGETEFAKKLSDPEIKRIKMALEYYNNTFGGGNKTTFGISR